MPENATALTIHYGKYIKINIDLKQEDINK
jgi:hypothetical protein